jgi:hypothetical protein
MIVTHNLISHYAEQMKSIIKMVAHFLGVDEGENAVNGWYYPRRAEYPWALEQIPPTGNVLDVGASLQFSAAILALFPETKLWIHQTWTDWEYFQKIFVGDNLFFPTEELFKREHKRLSFLLGEPRHFQGMEGHFDVIYNLSVMEHVEPENFLSWMRSLWIMLKEGGSMVVTYDYSPQYDDDGFWHHDFESFIAETGAIVSGEGQGYLSPDFESAMKQQGILVIPVNPMAYPEIDIDIYVSGFVLTKPFGE